MSMIFTDVDIRKILEPLAMKEQEKTLEIIKEYRDILITGRTVETKHDTKNGNIRLSITTTFKTNIDL